jgi:SAM-dependent methyltransferase
MQLLIPFLKFKRIRLWWVKIRYRILKKRMRFLQDRSSSIGEQTIKHNLTAFDSDAAFGCGERMALLIYPVVGYYGYSSIRKCEVKILIVGCRTEDDIYWMRSYGFSNTIGFDLFSYSDNVLVGDIHKTNFENASFDVVLLGWMISYSKEPTKVINECRRILKTGGLLGIGIDHLPNQNNDNLLPPRVNTLNSTADIIALLNSTINHKVLFEYDHYNAKNNDFSTTVVSICK